MKVADATYVTPVVPPSVMQAAIDPVRPIVDGSKSARDRRDGEQQQQGKGASFRAALDAATVGGLGQAFSAFGSDASLSAEAPPPERRPTNGRIELDAAEAAGLYRAAQAKSAPTGRDAAFSREHFTASREYAKRFFSVGASYAARGDILELRA